MCGNLPAPGKDLKLFYAERGDARDFLGHDDLSSVVLMVKHVLVRTLIVEGVGAALLTADGEMITGCNVENRSFPAGLCAERTAIFSAVAAGHRRFEAIAVAGGAQGKDPEPHVYSCGICLQVMSEFCDPDFIILCVNREDDVEEFRLRDLLPFVFDSLPEQ